MFATFFRRYGMITALLLAAALGCGVLAMRGAPKWRDAAAQREAAGRVVRAEDHMKTGLWRAAVVNAALLLALALTTPLWARGGPLKLPEGERPDLLMRPASRRPVISPQVFWAGLLLLVVAGGALRVPRMNLSVYNDEEHTVRTYVRGTYPRLTLDKMLEYEATEAGLPFKASPWAVTAWSTTGGPNHVLFSILSRASLASWQYARQLPESAFSAFYFRLPSLIAGLGLIMVAGTLLYRETGQGGLAWAAALLLATHPWLIRYSTEGRGYALMLFFMLLTWRFALGALRRPNFTRWIMYGVCQALLLMSYTGSVYLLLVLNVTLLAVLAWPLVRMAMAGGVSGKLLDTWHWRRFTRWVLGNLVTVLLYVPMILPLIPQYQAYFKTDFATVPTPPNWLEDFVAYSLAGVPWRTPAETQLPSVLGDLAQGNPLAAAAVVLVALFTLAGTVLLVLRRNPVAWLIPTIALAPVLGYWHNVAGNRTLYVWYLIFVVPGILVLAAAGMAPRLWFPAAMARRPRLAEAATLILALALAAACYLPQAWMLQNRPKENLVNAVRLAGRPVDPTGSTRTRVIHLACWTNNPIYDPWAITVIGPETVEETISYALETGRDIALTYGHRPLIAQHMPEALALMEDPGLFEPVTMIPGLEEAQFDIRYSRLRRDLDAQTITRTYPLTERQAERLAELPNGVDGLDVQLTYAGTAKFQPSDRTLVMRGPWPEHIKLRKTLSEMRE